MELQLSVVITDIQTRAAIYSCQIEFNCKP